MEEQKKHSQRVLYYYKQHISYHSTFLRFVKYNRHTLSYCPTLLTFYRLGKQFVKEILYINIFIYSSITLSALLKSSSEIVTPNLSAPALLIINWGSF